MRYSRGFHSTPLRLLNRASDRFLISAFEQGPGKWSARIGRAHGRPLKSRDGRLREFVTSVDQSSAVAASIMAMEAADAGSFSRNTKRRTERFLRLSASSETLAAVTTWNKKGPKQIAGGAQFGRITTTGLCRAAALTHFRARSARCKASIWFVAVLCKTGANFLESNYRAKSESRLLVCYFAVALAQPQAEAQNLSARALTQPTKSEKNASTASGVSGTS
jgi:hypothetical protein